MAQPMGAVHGAFCSATYGTTRGAIYIYIYICTHIYSTIYGAMYGLANGATSGRTFGWGLAREAQRCRTHCLGPRQANIQSFRVRATFICIALTLVEMAGNFVPSVRPIEPSLNTLKRGLAPPVLLFLHQRRRPFHRSSNASSQLWGWILNSLSHQGAREPCKHHKTAKLPNKSLANPRYTTCIMSLKHVWRVRPGIRKYGE